MIKTSHLINYCAPMVKENASFLRAKGVSLFVRKIIWQYNLMKHVTIKFLQTAFIFLFAVKISLAMGPDGAPWLAADEASCIGLPIQDFADAVGRPVDLRAELVLQDGYLPIYCRAVGTIAPSIGFEVRLPITDWSGRLLVQGCGLLCGHIEMQSTDDALIRGYVVAHTDMGHQALSTSDADWAYNNLELEEDFHHRATHLTTLAVKAITGAFYGQAQDHAYFRGCSTGGRQAIVEALWYPDDFDGIIGGAPAAGMVIPHTLWVLNANNPDGEDMYRRSVLGSNELKVINSGALAACDGEDGVHDGVIADPEGCSFDPITLKCSADGVGACIDSVQVDVARDIYAGAKTSKGEPVYSRGFTVGGELAWARGFVALDGRPPGAMVTADNFWRYWAYPEDAGPNAAYPPYPKFDFDTQPWTTGPDNIFSAPEGGSDLLTTFAEKGGKFVLYHGWSDDAITPATAIDFYNEQVSALGGRVGSDDALRLFVMPGVEHCGGGPGADVVDFLTIIENWVEKGEPPGSLLAHKLEDNATALHSASFPIDPRIIRYTRPVFPYPDVAIYSGNGNPHDAKNFLRKRRAMVVP